MIDDDEKSRNQPKKVQIDNPMFGAAFVTLRFYGLINHAGIIINSLGLWARSSTPSSLMMTQSSMRTPNLPGM